MPRRWLSMRTHKEEQIPIVKGSSEGFDFAFGFKSASADSSLASQHPEKPFVFGNTSGKVRRKPDLTLLIERPLSSRGYNGSHSATRSESSCIGVAFGSPPPQHFGVTDSNMGPSTHCLPDNSSPNRTPSFKKWRKIGALFRPRSNSEKTSRAACHCNQPVNAETHKLDVPIHRAQSRNPRLPADVQDASDTYHAIPRTDDRNERPKTSHGYDASSFQKFMEAHPAPSLQVKIPGSPFDRYSVMFKNINATPQLNLHRRRSRTIEKITPEPSPLHDNIDFDRTGLKRRLTSPTMSNPDDTSASRSGSGSGLKMSSSSRYSLFPHTPTSSRPQSRHQPSNPSYSRPWTAPGQVLSPEGNSLSPPKQQARKSSSKSQLRVTDIEKELPLLSPPTLLGTRNPSNHSRGSSNGEIFFEVKSLRDSRGIDVNQYEMRRPPSVELQLARSKSNARKQMQCQSTISSMPEEVEERPGKSTSAQIDDTIALVESLTSASALAVASTRVTETVSPRRVSSQHQQAIATLPNDADSIAIHGKRIKASKLKPEGLNIDVPSPVLESIEEMSPRTVTSRHSIALITEGSTSVRLDRIASRARANSNETKPSRARLMQELPIPRPPVVPVKDSKLIPLSKYAPKHTAEDVVRQTGLRPTRPLRSKTDDSASYNHSASVFRRQFPVERSCTMPSGFTSSPGGEAMIRPALAGRRSSPHINQGMPMVVAYVKPSAEVSVARTVSLSRNASAKITVSKQPLRSTPKLSSHSEEDVTKKEVVERLPVLLEVNSKHKPGLSQNAVLEVEAGIPSNPGCLPSVNDFERTLDIFPTPPSVTL